MPQKLSKKEEVSFNGRSQYDWDTYFKLTRAIGPDGELYDVKDGQEGTHSYQYRFLKGEDFDITVESFRNTVCTAARSKRFGLKTSTHIEYKVKRDAEGKPVLDKNGDEQLVMVAAKDADGNAMKDEAGKPVMEPVPIGLVVMVRKPTPEEAAAAAAKATAEPATATA